MSARLTEAQRKVLEQYRRGWNDAGQVARAVGRDLGPVRTTVTVLARRGLLLLGVGREHITPAGLAALAEGEQTGGGEHG